MIRIGITGSFASGKSELLKYFIQCGYPGFSCDKAVHAIHNDPLIQKRILYTFPEIEKFDKIKIAQVVYADNSKRKILEDLMHPLVAEKMQKFLDEWESSSLIFLEIPLLFEAKWEQYCDYIISLHCTKSVRRERALGRGIDGKMFEAIDKSQLPEYIKNDFADFTIDTDCDFSEVVAECKKIIKLIL